MKRWVGNLFFGLAMLGVVLGAPQVPVHAGAARVVQHRSRLDTHLRGIVDEAAPGPQRVIIRVRPGTRSTLPG